MARNFRDFCCDPFKSHMHRIYSYLRVAMITEHHSLCIRSGDLACCNCLCKLNPEIAFVDTSSGSHPTQAVVGPSNSSSQHGAGPSSPNSQHGAGPSSPNSQHGAGPSSPNSQHGAGPSSPNSQHGAGPSSPNSQHGAGPSSPNSQHGAGPSSPNSQHGAGPSSPNSQHGAGPSSPNSQHGAGPSTHESAPSSVLSTCTPVKTEDSNNDEQLELFKANETLVLHGISPTRKRAMQSKKSFAEKMMR